MGPGGKGEIAALDGKPAEIWQTAFSGYHIGGNSGFRPYHGLFQTALEEYGANIFAYFYELSFEETLRRPRTKLNRVDFGETEMRRWWRERDYLTIITETVLKEDLSLEDAVEMIYRRVTAGSLGETT